MSPEISVVRDSFTGPDAATVNAVTAPYRDVIDTPIEEATLLRFTGADLTADLDEDQIEAAFTCAEMVALAGFARRRFFIHGKAYSKRDNYRLVVQRFFVARLESQWRAIRAECEALPEDLFDPWVQREMYGEGWSVYGLIAFGKPIDAALALCPRTAAAISSIPNLTTAGFSRLAPGAHIKPHIGWVTTVYRSPRSDRARCVRAPRWRRHAGAVSVDHGRLRVGCRARRAAPRAVTTD